MSRLINHTNSSVINVVQRYAYTMVIQANAVDLFPLRLENLFKADTRKTPVLRALVTVVCEDTTDRGKLYHSWEQILVDLFYVVETFFYSFYFPLLFPKKDEG